MRNTAYFQQANNMSTMMQTTKEERDMILNEVKDSKHKILRAMEMSDKTNVSVIDQRDDDSTPIYSNQFINRASDDTVQLDILKLLKEMRDDNNESRKRRRRNPRNDNTNNNDNNNDNKTMVETPVTTITVTTMEIETIATGIATMILTRTTTMVLQGLFTM